MQGFPSAHTATAVGLAVGLGVVISTRPLVVCHVRGAGSLPTYAKAAPTFSAIRSSGPRWAA